MQYIRVSDVVNELCVMRKDDDRQEFLAYMIASKTVLQDLRVVYIPDFKRIFIPVNPSTMSARLPFDYMRFRTISAMQKCKDKWGKDTLKPIPLTYNPYVNITPVPSTVGCPVCGCEATHPVCVELASYTPICEEIVIDPNSDPVLTGTKQTVLKTCANGDIIKEVTEPTLKFVKGAEQCDYNVTMEVMRETVCDYTLVISISLVANTHNIRLIKNGFNIDSGVLTAGWAATNNFFHSIGWIVDSNGHYHLNNSTDVYDYTVIVTDASDIDHSFTLTRNCKEDNILTFPYNILSYTKNNLEITESPVVEIESQADQDSFFEGLGFTKVDNTHYILEDSTDVYYNMIVELVQSPTQSPAEYLTIPFIQDNCNQPLISDGVSNSLYTDVLCNVEIKDCGCIPETPTNIETIVSCCAPYLNCCQVGELNNWSGWSYVPSCCHTNTPQPYNPKGTYNIDQKNFIIYFDSVSVQGLLLAYDNDGSCDGDFAFPNYMMKAFKAGLAHEHSLFNESFTERRRAELSRLYETEKTDMDKIYIDPIRMSDLVGALKTPLTPY